MNIDPLVLQEEMKKLYTEVRKARQNRDEALAKLRPLEDKYNKMQNVLEALQGICEHDSWTRHTDFRNHGRDVWETCDTCGLIRNKWT